MAGYSGNSIVDYLSSTGQDASFGNRTKLAQQYGLNNYTGTASQNMSLLNSLRSGSTPTTKTPAAPAAQATPQANYQNSTARQNAQKWQNATIDDIAKKYGFDYSQEFANRQAETEAQAKRNAQNAAKRENETLNQETMKMIDMGVREANQGLDHQYFQEFLNQQQSLANAGLNAGLAQDANLRLGMNKQSQLANVFRDANLARSQESNRFNNESTRLAEALALVEQEREMRAQTLFQELRQMGYQNLTSERDFYTTVDQNEWQRMQQELARQFEREQFEWQKKMQEAELALQRQAAAARRSSSGGGGGSSSSASTSKAKTSASNLLNQYKNQQNLPLTKEDQYYLAQSKKYPDQKAVSNLSPAYTNMKRLFTIPSYSGGSTGLRTASQFLR